MMAYPQDDKRVGSITAMLAVNDVPRLLRRPPHTEEWPTTPVPPCRHTTLKRWIPLDLVQNTAEYLGRVPSLLSFRGVSTGWQDAVSDAVGFLNGRCWTRLGKDGPLWRSLCLDDADVVARCALLCLAPRLKWFDWYMADQLDFALRLLGENNTVLTNLSLGELHRDDSKRTMDLRPALSGLRNCHVLKTLYLPGCGVTDAGIRGLELILTLENLNLGRCTRVTDVNFLRNCRALKWLNLALTSATDAGIRGLELIPTLEELNLRECEQITDVSFLQNCRALKKLVLTYTNVTDAGIRGLELIPTLEDLDLACCRISDVRCLRDCRALKLLTLWDSNVTDAGIRGLELIPTLEIFDLALCERITDVSGLRYCRSLKKLHLASTSVTDKGIWGVELIPTLEELNLRRCRRITDVNFLRNCRALKTLHLQSTKVTDAGIRGLELIPTLVVLNLCECHQLGDLSALRNRWARLDITTLLL
jgi:Leucine-rich repeat (LRR) protein